MMKIYNSKNIQVEWRPGQQLSKAQLRGNVRVDFSCEASCQQQTTAYWSIDNRRSLIQEHSAAHTVCECRETERKR